MAHRLDNSKGFYAFTAVGQAAWHKLGKVYPEGFTMTAEQTIQDAGLDFQVLKLPNVHILPDESEIISKNSFFTVRTDTNAILGDKFGPVYEVLQNVEAFNVVDEILQAGTATIESAGAIDGGAKTFICLKIAKPIIIGSNDQVNQYILIANSHDGSIAITATPTNIRVVCYNTLSAALGAAQGALKIRHTINSGDRLKEAAKVLKLIATNTEVNTENYNKMRELLISKEDMMNYFGNIFLTGEEMQKLQTGTKLNDAISSQKQNTLLELSKYAAQGVGQIETLNNGSLTMWSAFNAVTGFLSRKKFTNADDRANSMLFGTTAQKIQNAGNLALAPEKIQRLSKTNNIAGLNLN